MAQKRKEVTIMAGNTVVMNEYAYRLLDCISDYKSIAEACEDPKANFDEPFAIEIINETEKALGFKIWDREDNSVTENGLQIMLAYSQLNELIDKAVQAAEDL